MVSESPEQWDHYYKPIFDLLIARMRESTIFTMVDHDSDRHLLHLACELGLPWGAISRILIEDVSAVSIQDSQTGLRAYMLCIEGSTNGLSSAYELLLFKPDML